jgi:hypothetical protein
MELASLSLHAVRFMGPSLARRGRGALSAAGVSVLQRHPSVQWGPQVQEYLVSVDARSESDAIRRVEAALLGQGNYGGYSAAIRSLR